MFFLCTVEHYSIMKPVFLHKFKSYNKEIGKPDESLGRKATGQVTARWPYRFMKNADLSDLTIFRISLRTIMTTQFMSVVYS